VSGGVVGHARPVSIRCDPREAPGMYGNFIPNILCRVMGGQVLSIIGGGVETGRYCRWAAVIQREEASGLCATDRVRGCTRLVCGELMI